MSAKDDIEGVVIVGAIGFAAYALYTVYEQISKAGGAVANAVGAAAAATSSNIADTAQDILGTGIAAPGQSYQVTMPDGSVQNVQYGSLPTSGLGRFLGNPKMNHRGEFTHDGVRYQTYIAQRGGNLVARAIP